MENDQQIEQQEAPKPQGIDPAKARQLLDSTVSVLNAAAKLNEATADIIDPEVVEEKQAEIEEKKEKRRAQLREAQAKFAEKTKAENEAQALQIRKLQAEVAAIEGLMTELAELRPLVAQLDESQKATLAANERADSASAMTMAKDAELSKAERQMNRWRVATLVLAVIAAVAITLAM